MIQWPHKFFSMIDRLRYMRKNLLTANSHNKSFPGHSKLEPTRIR